MAAEHVPAAPVAERLAAQLLSGAPAKTAPGVAERLLAVQAQDPRGFRLAIRARTSGLTAADVDAAFSEDRSVVVTWLNRGTLHLVTAADYWWLHPLTTSPMVTGNARRLAQEGVPPRDAERAVAVIERSLSAEGPLTRAQLGERIAAAGVRTQGQALEEFGLPAPKLLGAFDPVLLGWTSREPIVGRYGPMIASNGMIRSFAMAGGSAVATWTMPGGKVSLAPFVPISETDLAALTEDAADVERFLAAGGWIGGAGAALG